MTISSLSRVLPDVCTLCARQWCCSNWISQRLLIPCIGPSCLMCCDVLDLATGGLVGWEHCWEHPPFEFFSMVFPVGSLLIVEEFARATRCRRCSLSLLWMSLILFSSRRRIVVFLEDWRPEG